MDCSPPATHVLCPWGFSRQEYWTGCHALPQGILPTQRSNSGLSHCRQILYCLSHQGSSYTVEVPSIPAYIGTLKAGVSAAPKILNNRESWRDSGIQTSCPVCLPCWPLHRTMLHCLIPLISPKLRKVSSLPYLLLHLEKFSSLASHIKIPT